MHHLHAVTAVWEACSAALQSRIITAAARRLWCYLFNRGATPCLAIPTTNPRPILTTQSLAHVRLPSVSGCEPQSSLTCYATAVQGALLSFQTVSNQVRAVVWLCLFVVCDYSMPWVGFKALASGYTATNAWSTNTSGPALGQTTAKAVASGQYIFYQDSLALEIGSQAAPADAARYQSVEDCLRTCDITPTCAGAMAHAKSA